MTGTWRGQGSFGYFTQTRWGPIGPPFSSVYACTSPPFCSILRRSSESSGLWSRESGVMMGEGAEVSGRLTRIARESPTLAQKSLFADYKSGYAGATGEAHIKRLFVKFVISRKEG